MSLATDILKRSGLAPLSPRAKTRIYKRGVHKTNYDIYGRAVVSAKFTPKGFAYIAERISK